MTEVLKSFCRESIQRFYNDGIIDFADYLDDDVVWYGPNENSVIRGKENLIGSLTGHSGKISFSVENMTVDLIPAGSGCTTVVLAYRLVADYGGGRVSAFGQHLVLTVNRRKKNGEYVWNCPVIHVSDTVRSGRKAGDTFLVDEEFVGRADSYIKSRTGVRKIAFRGEGNSTVFIPEDSVIYAEAGKGVKCWLHLAKETVAVNMLLKDVTAKLPAYYYRCHSSFTVNTRMISSVAAYRITLVNGEEIPVPEKKYAKVKKEIGEKAEL